MRAIAAEADEAIAEAATSLDAGELVVIPGDLRYLVAADALDDAAVERLFMATDRPADRALTVLIAGYEDLHHVAYGGAEVRALSDEHWPGPTTFALRARPWLPDALTAAQETVQVSVPANAFARGLARHFGPLAVATARRAVSAHPLTAAAARSTFPGEVALFVDGGPLPGGSAKVIPARELARS